MNIVKVWKVMVVVRFGECGLASEKVLVNVSGHAFDSMRDLGHEGRLQFLHVDVIPIDITKERVCLDPIDATVPCITDPFARIDLKRSRMSKL